MSIGDRVQVKPCSEGGARGVVMGRVVYIHPLTAILPWNSTPEAGSSGKASPSITGADRSKGAS